MAAAKARGAKFASARHNHWNGREGRRTAGAHAGGKKAAIVHARRADAAYRDVAPLILQHRKSGASLRSIADILNSEGIPTRQGKSWHAATVRLVINRFAGN